ncbi:MAG: hypothetical protein R3E32_21320 [Chitinophagales bacterium]
MILKKIHIERKNLDQTFKSEKKLIREIYEIIKEYRKGDLVFDGKDMNKVHIKRWVYQFDKKDRIFMLKMTKMILKRYYINKSAFRNFFKVTLFEKIESEFLKEGDNFEDFFQNSYFIRSQRSKEKSQAAVLKILDELLCKFDSSVHNNNSNPKYCIYLDDVICSGTSLYKCLRDKKSGWLHQNDFDHILSNKDFMERDNIHLLIITYCSHLKAENDFKKIKKENPNINFTFICEKNFKIDNYTKKSSSMLMCPLPTAIEKNTEKFSEIKKVQNKIEEIVAKNNSRENSHFYRYNIDKPEKNSFFSENPENWIKFEKIIAEKSIQLFCEMDSSDEKARPLGYSTKIDKSFGFGTLFFTWRNVPFNTPMIFWYEKKGTWIPLFKRKYTKHLKPYN